MHNLADVHETALRKPPAGVGWMAHFLPFHRSASCLLSPNGLAAVSPTAVHALAEVHDTPLKSMRVAPAGLGVGWMTHFLPFHRCASPKERPELTEPARST
jgi:hypothetical protein